MVHHDRWRRNGTPGPAEVQVKRPGALCGIPECDRPHYARGYCNAHHQRWWATGNPGPAEVRVISPRGEVIGYSAAHLRVRQARGRAAAHFCAHGCGAVAAHWAYDHTDPDALIGTVRSGSTGQLRPAFYSLDPARYQPLCPSCHIRFDRNR